MTDNIERTDVFINPRSKKEETLLWVLDGKEKSRGEARSSGVLVELSPAKIYRMWIKDYSDYENTKEIDVEKDVVERYLELKLLGFPVVETLRISEDRKKVLMTDVTENGKHDVVDFHEQFDENIRIVNYEELIEDVKELYKKGTDNGLLFPHLAVVVDKDTGVGKVMILDLAEVSDFVQDDWNEDLVNINNRWMDNFIDQLSGLRQ